MAIRRFSSAANACNKNRALQVYQYLICCAANNRTCTYKDVANVIGYKGAGVLENILGHIHFWCVQNDLPKLTCIVVNKITGRPGHGLSAWVSDIDKERVAVFNQDWWDIMPPTPNEMAHLFTIYMSK